MRWQERKEDDAHRLVIAVRRRLSSRARGYQSPGG
jgi:hypothetical protein